MWKKKLLSDRHQRKLLRSSARFLNYSARQLQFKAGGQCAKVNTRSIRRYLQRLGCGARKPLKSPSWTRTQRLRRHNWNNVFFSDKMYIELFHNNSQYVRKHRNANVDKKHCVEHSPLTRNFWSGAASLLVVLQRSKSFVEL